ncbi:MAG: Holliday junction resolvase RuvX [Chlamydiota bacterium]|nr:Holliday junction resolvase RuvX [Chlamydiota bacterium]
MTVLALDIGQKNIGVAVSDPEWKFAFGLPNIENLGKDQVLSQLGKIILSRQISVIVLGLPVHMSGRESKGSLEVLEWKKRIENDLHIQVETWDERLTTQCAQRVLLDADMSRKKRKKIVDRMSAQIILQDFLIYKKSIEGKQS